MSPPACRLPEFITFTGADDHTSIAEMAGLSRRYPIEWGVLLNPTRQGIAARFPGEDALARLMASGLRLSAHLCGSYAASIMRGLGSEIPLDLTAFERFQINHARPDAARISRFGERWGRRCIAQTRGFAFSSDTSVEWLFDASGGRGIAPSEWPPYPGRLVGYAGGIGPENAASVIEAIDAAGPYWIDMENRVRTDDRFDLVLCELVCAEVYGR
jgi:hypothetical protein